MKNLSAKQKLLLADALLIPVLLGAKLLSSFLLVATNNPCGFTLLGGKCVTCGGTHFVRSILSFRFGEAFAHNQLLFVLGVILVVCYCLLHLKLLWNVGWAEKLLKKIWSFPVLKAFLFYLVVFAIIRAVPIFVNLWEKMQQLL